MAGHSRRLNPDPGDLLEQSMQLLDQAMSPLEKNRIHMNRNTPQTQSLARKRDVSLGSANSLACNGTPVKDRYTFDSSLTTNLSQLRSGMEEATCTSSLLRGKELWKSASDRLFLGFLEIVQSHGLEQQAFEMVASFAQNCTDLLHLISDMGDKVSESDLATHKLWLEDERNTWRLVYCLYQNRAVQCGMERDHAGQLEDLGTEEMLGSRRTSEREIMLQLYRSDTVVRECQLVIDWLEKNASDQRQPQAGLQHYSDKTTAWENTLLQLQTKNVAFMSRRPMVTKLDPDAQLRQGRPLHDLDQEDEARLVREVFLEIRCGNFDQAQAICMHSGQPWRAATLEGWRLYHDPNYDTIIGSCNEKAPVEGNPNRDLWKLCAWNLAEDRRMPLLARATHGALCGHLPAMLLGGNSWEDQLWAHLKALVDVSVEQEIRAVAVRSYVPMPDAYFRNRTSVEEVFEELSASKDPKVRDKSQCPIQVVQKYVVLDQVPELMAEMRTWLEDPDPHLVRFLAHLVLFLRFVGHGALNNVGNAVLRTYVELLMGTADPRLVSYYTAALPQPDQVPLYARFLESVTERDARLACLEAAEDSGLDVEAITRTVVENIRSYHSDGELLTLMQFELSQDDLTKVSALDWVVFYPSQRGEALWQANALLRHFLGAGKYEAAKRTFSKIPEDSLDILSKQHRLNWTKENPDDLEALPARISSAIREFLYFKAYLDAHESFTDWFEHYHNSKPKSPTHLPDDAAFTERVAFDHRQNQYKSELERWRLVMAQQTKTAKSRLYNVLLFPDGGWMQDPNLEDRQQLEGEEAGRAQQMANLRQLYIPKVVLLLLTVMHSVGEFAECVRVADVIASERHQLYKVYTKQGLSDLLHKISDSSLSLLDQKRDAWGHPVST